MNAQSPRSRALARQDEQIDRNIATIEAQKARPTAIQAMAARLNITPVKLQETLRNTVFSKANDHEFAALIVVANEYGLNPLTKEIYAFPAKGGGIVPIVSIDGWIRITNQHPQFDGIEFNDIYDEKGDLEAIECVIHRKDRSRPIKVPEYLDECQQNTDPWKKMPHRMLRHKALIQCARVAFGFSGIMDEDEGRMVYAGDLTPARSAPLPRDAELIEHQPASGTHNEPEDEDVARALDAGFDPHTGEIVDSGEGPSDDQRGEAVTLESAMAEIDRAEIVADVNARVSALAPLLSDGDADELRAHAMGRIAEMKAKK